MMESKSVSSIPTMLDYVVKDAVIVDFGEGYELGYDQEGMNYPRVFAVVKFQLVDTTILCRIADRVCKDDGYSIPDLDYLTEEIWYNFTVGINDCTESHLDTCIEFEAVGGNSGNVLHTGIIDLSNEEQTLIYACIDNQCKQRLGRSCADLLKEAENEYIL